MEFAASPACVPSLTVTWLWTWKRCVGHVLLCARPVAVFIRYDNLHCLGRLAGFLSLRARLSSTDPGIGHHERERHCSMDTLSDQPRRPRPRNRECCVPARQTWPLRPSCAAWYTSNRCIELLDQLSRYHDTARKQAAARAHVQSTRVHDSYSWQTASIGSAHVSMCLQKVRTRTQRAGLGHQRPSGNPLPVMIALSLSTTHRHWSLLHKCGMPVAGTAPDKDAEGVHVHGGGRARTAVLEQLRRHVCLRPAPKPPVIVK